MTERDRGGMVAGAIFLVLGALFLLEQLGVFRFRASFIWAIALIGLGLAVLIGGAGRDSKSRWRGRWGS
jgi:hypothetical protein